MDTIEVNNVVEAIFGDLSKAHDCLCPELELRKSGHTGVNDEAKR